MSFTRVVGAGIHTLSNITSHNIHSSGIITAVGLDVNGNGDISGNLSVGGVQTDKVPVISPFPVTGL